MVKKILITIFSLLLFGMLSFFVVWSCINFDTLKAFLSGTQIYTDKELNNAYNDGFNDGVTNKKELEELVSSYRDTITSQRDEISQAHVEIDNLTKTINENKSKIETLENVKLQNEEQISKLTEEKNNNLQTINSLTSEKENLLKQIENLEEEVNSGAEDVASKLKEIEKLTKQVTSLNALISQLQQTNESNQQTISNLNNQVVILNSQINELMEQMQGNSSVVNALNTKIAELEKSVKYYENYIAQLENGEQVVATFEFNGSVVNIQIVAKNSKLSVLDPNSTDYVSFNWWEENGERVDFDTYTITKNTKFIANVTRSFDAKFIVDNVEFNSQIVEENTCASAVGAPVKEGYEFDGWMVNNQLVDCENYEITEHTTFVAKFTKLHNVTYMLGSDILTTESVRNGEFAKEFKIEETEYLKFNYWEVNGVRVDLGTYKILSDTTIVANITRSYDVKFIVDGVEYGSQIVEENTCVSAIDAPVKEGYMFKGWSVDGVNVIDISNYKINENVEFYAIFEEKIGFKYEEFKEMFGSNKQIFYLNNQLACSFGNSYIDLFNVDFEFEDFEEIGSYLIYSKSVYSVDAMAQFENKLYYSVYIQSERKRYFCEFDLENKNYQELFCVSNYCSSGLPENIFKVDKFLYIPMKETGVILKYNLETSEVLKFSNSSGGNIFDTELFGNEIYFSNAKYSEEYPNKISFFKFKLDTEEFIMLDAGDFLNLDNKTKAYPYLVIANGKLYLSISYGTTYDFEIKLFNLINDSFVETFGNITDYCVESYEYVLSFRNYKFSIFNKNTEEFSDFIQISGYPVIYACFVDTYTVFMINSNGGYNYYYLPRN